MVFVAVGYRLPQHREVNMVGMVGDILPAQPSTMMYEAWQVH